LLLLFVYAWTAFYYAAMILVVAAIGILVGMELPLLTRILESRSGLRRGISQVLTFDYIGALAASLLFPFILLPYFGHLMTAAAIGLVNLFVALVVAYTFRAQLQPWRGSFIAGIAVALAMLFACILWIKPAEVMTEAALYEDPVISTQQSTYQKIVLTQRGEDFRLYLDGNLQFSSVDEYRYHEVLVHLPASFTGQLQRALVIGGGDGLAARELLHYPDIQSVDVVDLDSAVTNEDAWSWLAKSGSLYDLIVIDLPDPESEDMAKLYSVAFYKRVARRLSVGGVMITQATSPWFARRAFWSIGSTIESVFEHAKPVTVYVPSFGLWGFFIAANHSLEQPSKSVHQGRYINDNTAAEVLRIPADLPRLSDTGSMNTADKQAASGTDLFFPLQFNQTLPDVFPSPFEVRPHAVAEQAAASLKQRLPQLCGDNHTFDAEDGGKMFGVLVVKNARSETGYLAAFSGMLEQGWNCQGFVGNNFQPAAK